MVKRHSNPHSCLGGDGWGFEKPIARKEIEVECMHETRALRAHTPRAPCICVIVQLGHMLLMTFTYTY